MQKFPWYPEPVNKLSGSTASEINDFPSLIWFSEKNKGQLEELTPIAKEWIKKWNDAEGDREMVFFVSFADDSDDEDDGIRESLLKFTGLNKKGKKEQLAIVDIPGQKVSPLCDTTET